MKFSTPFAVVCAVAVGAVSASPIAVESGLEERAPFVAPLALGYQAPFSWGSGNCAINAPGNTYIRQAFFPGSTDYTLCAKQCSDTTFGDAKSSNGGLFDSCNYVTAYQLFENGVFKGTECGLYKKNFRGQESGFQKNCGNGKVTLKSVVSYTINGYFGDNVVNDKIYRSDMYQSAAIATRARVGA